MSMHRFAITAALVAACSNVSSHPQRAGTAGVGGAGGGGGTGGSSAVPAPVPVFPDAAAAGGTRGTADASAGSADTAGAAIRLDTRAPDVAAAGGTGGAAVADAGATGPAGAPSAYFDLRNWKLTIPGPKEFDPPVLTAGYTSKYFFADTAARTMIFALDASEKGSTSGSDYVRSELREQITPSEDSVNWTIAGTHVLSARLRLKSTTLNPNKVTVLQIHGYGDGVLPLLKVAIENGTALNALIKTNASGSNEQKVTIAPVSVGTFFDCEIRVQDAKLTITVNGSATAVTNRDVSYWTKTNYFKAGLYPQTTSGVAQVEFAKLSRSHM